MERSAARVIVLDEQGRTLLFRGGDPARPEAGTWWFTPGGGVEGDETLLEAARRELREETGLRDVPLTGPIFHRETEFEFAGEVYQQREAYFSVIVPAFVVDVGGWTAAETATLRESRWWSLPDLEATEETVYPENLPALVIEISETH